MKRLEKNRKKIIALQDTLYAEHKQSLLVVLQAMDAAGKDSTIKDSNFSFCGDFFMDTPEKIMRELFCAWLLE